MKKLIALLMTIALIVACLVTTITNIILVKHNKQIMTEIKQSNNIQIEPIHEKLAIMVSNGDSPEEEILAAAKGKYRTYTELCDDLINMGLLIYIPEYIDKTGEVIEENLVTPNTIAYDLAIEAGIIK